MPVTMSETTQCICGKSIAQPATGRPRAYCSGACKQRAYRQSVTKDATENVTKLKPDIQFYCGLNEKYWNHHEVEPGRYVCIAPVTSSNEVTPETRQLPKDEQKRRKVLRKTHVLIDDTKVKHIMIDSGAFSDGIELQDGSVIENKRLSFDHALQRQIAHAYDFRYAHLVESIVSYDLLIDETWQDGERSKLRWSVEAAEFAVAETIKAARYLASQRQRIDRAFNHHVRLVLSAQGVEAEQYKRCAQEIVKVMQPDDIFGLGGWCITGLIRHAMLPAAAQILPGVFEVLGKAGVKRVHVFGVIIPALLGFLLHLCDQYGMELSTDSAGPCVEPARNGNWGFGSWRDNSYRVAPVLESCRHEDEQGKKAATCTSDLRCRGNDRILHVKLTREWLANFRERESDLICMIKPPVISPYEQISWIEAAS